MEGEAKATLKEFIEEKGEGNFNRHNQLLKIQYLQGNGKLTPKVVIVVTTSEDNMPRSYRTDNPERIRDIIKCMIQCLHRLEDDLKH